MAVEDWVAKRAIEYLKTHPGCYATEVSYAFKDMYAVTCTYKSKKPSKMKKIKLKYIPSRTQLARFFMNHENVIRRKGYRKSSWFYFIGDVSEKRCV